MSRLPSPDNDDEMGVIWAAEDNWEFYDIESDGEETNKNKVFSKSKELYARLGRAVPGEEEEEEEMLVVGCHTAKKGRNPTMREHSIDDSDKSNRIAVFCKYNKNKPPASWKPLFAVEIYKTCSLYFDENKYRVRIIKENRFDEFGLSNNEYMQPSFEFRNDLNYVTLGP